MKTLRLIILLILISLFVSGGVNRTIWKADTQYSRSARVVLRPVEDWNEAINKYKTFIYIDSVYWIEKDNQYYYFYGDKPIPKMFPMSRFYIDSIVVK